MNIILFTSEIGGTAPGIVFERLLEALSAHHNITVYATKSKSRLSEKMKLILVDRFFFHPRIEEFINIILGSKVLDKIWAYRVYFSYKRLYKDFDLIISFASGGKFVSLYAGEIFKRKYKLPWIVYTTDAIPPPIGWSKENLYFKLHLKLVRNLLVEADSLIAANERMLSYQLSLFSPKNDIITDYIYPSSLRQENLHLEKRVPENIFLYTGNIYGSRDPSSYILAFSNLLETYSNSKLIFVGASFPKGMIDSYSAHVKCKIEIKDFVDDLLPFYSRCTALIDIDANIENDVFISSKIFTYLSINRPIICVTNITSLTKRLFDDMLSVKICNHSPDEICIAMKNCIENYDSINYSDRKSKLDLVDIDWSINKFNEIVNKVAYK